MRRALAAEPPEQVPRRSLGTSRRWCTSSEVAARARPARDRGMGHRTLAAYARVACLASLRMRARRYLRSLRAGRERIANGQSALK